MSYDETKLESLLLGLLYALGTNVYRTKLVKMTYLIDESNYRLRGSTITGLTYTWDNYGPNAESNDIVAVLDRLAAKGRVTMTRVSNYYGSPGYRYEIAGDMDIIDLQLTDADWLEIKAAVQNYKHKSVDSITRASKATEPIQRAGQYDTLEFRQDTSLNITDEEVAEDPFLQETLHALRSDTGKRVSLEELRERIA